MAPELQVLAWGGLLLLVHIFVAGHFKTRQYGTKWNIGARDESPPPMSPITGRATRSQANFLETLPLAIIALAGVAISGRTGAWTMIAAWSWLIARAIYLPIYLMGIPVIRSLLFLISLAGLLIVLWPLLLG